MEGYLIDLCLEKALTRCRIKNSCNGHSYMEALIIDKKRYCVLRG